MVCQRGFSYLVRKLAGMNMYLVIKRWKRTLYINRYGYVMKTSIVTVILILAVCFSTSANQDCIWTSSKSGVTIHFVAPCDFKNQTLLDSIVNKMAFPLKRQDTSLKIIVFVSHGHLSFPNAEFANFFSIGYDTLRPIDDDYIFNHYWNQESISTSKNGGLNTFESKRAPLDINASITRSTNEIGIKIIYDKDYRLGEPDWMDIAKAIAYAANNADIVKLEQTRDTVRYNTNGWYVSLVTIDTFEINAILGKEPVKNKQKTKAVATTTKSYYMMVGIGMLLISLFFLLPRKRN